MSRAGSPRVAWRWAAAAALLGLATWVVWRPILALGLFGWDSYPLILAGRVRDAGELLGTFGEELMDGAYPLGRFYRPLTHLAFGVDHALWGLEPRGYHATDALLLAACAVAVLLLARRLFGGGAFAAALFAGLLYVLHPVQLEILPVPARRAEALACLFSLLALLAQPLPASSGAGARWLPRALLAGCFCLCAVAAKETGAAAVGFVLCLALAPAKGAGWPQRIARALRVCWPSIALFALFVGVRTLVLDGLGGSAESSLTANLGAAPGILRGYLGQLSGAPAGAVADMLVVALVALLVLLARGAAGRAQGEPHGGLLTLGQSALLCLHAVLVLALFTSVSGLERGWYALPFLPWFVLACALALQLSLRALGRAQRAAGGVGLALCAVLFLLNLLPTLLRDDLDAFRRASADQADFLARFDATLLAAPDGATVAVAGLPTERRADPADPDSRNLLMLAPYSVSAYAALRFPERRLRIELAGRRAAPAAPGEVVVVLAP